MSAKHFGFQQFYDNTYAVFILPFEFNACSSGVMFAKQAFLQTSSPIRSTISDLYRSRIHLQSVFSHLFMLSVYLKPETKL